MIAIVNYGLGNVHAFANVYKRLGINCRVCSKPDDFHSASKILLPGVGSFDHAISRLERSGMLETLKEMVVSAAIPVLGICVGMQILADSSEEGHLPGLGWIPGKVQKMDSSTLTHKTRLPHMGWNLVKPSSNCQLFKGIEENPRFYFLHSFCFHCNDPIHSIATAEYGNPFTCSVNCKNIYGVQFHPEKSHHNGVSLLKNFAAI